MTNFTSDCDSVLKDAFIGLFFGGEFRPASNGETFDAIDSVTDNPLVQAASVTEEDAKQVLDDVVAAQKEWKATPSRERSEILYRAFELIHRDADRLAQLQFPEMGRTLPDSKAEVGHGSEFLRWFTGETMRISGDYRISPGGSSRAVVIKQPVGPVLAITPWNFLLAMGTRRIVPAPAAGYPVITKPASEIPLTMLYLGKLSIEVGAPTSVISILPTGHSTNVSGLPSDDRLRKFAFTGSTEVGQVFAMKVAEISMKVSLEPGGNAPFVILSGGDVDKAVQVVNDAKFRNGGQMCIASNRFTIREPKKNAFVEGVVRHLAELKLGGGTDPAMDLGPLALRDQQKKVRDLVDDAVKRDAKVECGGKIPNLGGTLSDGYFFELIVLADMPEDADIVREGIFGLVVAMTTFVDNGRVIEQANGTILGLAAYVFSKNLAEVLSTAEALESGMVAVNKGPLLDPSAPLDGVKQSGLGREGGFTGIDKFLEEKLISLEG